MELATRGSFRTQICASSEQWKRTRSRRLAGRRLLRVFAAAAMLAGVCAGLLWGIHARVKAPDGPASLPLDALTWTPLGPAPTGNGPPAYIEPATRRIPPLAAHPPAPKPSYIPPPRRALC